MLAAWREHLRSSGACTASGRSLPPERAAREAGAALRGDIVTDLSHRGLIAVYGADARTLLQGQLTNDIEALGETRTQLSAWCSIKGRVLALFRIWQIGERHFLELPADLQETITARLRRYVLRARVTIADASGDAVRFGVSGARVAEGLETQLGSLPERPDRALRSGQCTTIRLRGDRPRFQVIAPLERATALWDRCREHAVPVGAFAWDLLDIRAGIANIPASSSDRFLPQMLHLHSVNGLSFRKGCYAGQEIVARTEYLGRLKRRLHRAALECAEAPSPGDTIYAGGGGEEPRPAGEVVNVAPAAHPHRWELLAVIADEAVAAGGLGLRDARGPELDLRPLPGSGDSEAA